MASKEGVSRPRRHAEPSAKVKSNQEASRGVSKANKKNNKGAKVSKKVSVTLARTRTPLAEHANEAEALLKDIEEDEETDSQDIDAYFDAEDEQITPQRPRRSIEVVEVSQTQQSELPPGLTQSTLRSPPVQRSTPSSQTPLGEVTFAYNVQLVAWYGKERVESKAYSEGSIIGCVAALHLQQWFDDIAGFICQRIELTAIAGNRRMISSTYVKLDDWGFMVSQLKEAYLQSKKNLIIEAKGILAKRSETTAGTPRVTATPALGRNCETNRQLANSAAVRSQLVEDGNYAVQLAERWPCRLNTCKQSVKDGGTCWRKNNKDVPECHYPVYGVALTAWSAGIAEGRLTVEDPGSDIAMQLAELKAKGLTAKKKKKSDRKRPRRLNDSDSDSDSSRRAYKNIIYACPPPSSSSRRRHKHDSSPIRLDSSQTGPSERLLEFFDWCRWQPAWKGCEDDLARLERIFEEDGYDVESIGQIELSQWKEKGFKEGLWYRIRQSVKKWRVDRAAKRQVQQSDSDS